MTVIDNDGFILVTYKKNRRKKVKSGRRVGVTIDDLKYSYYAQITKPAKPVKTTIQELQTNLKNSSFFIEFKEIFSNVLKKWRRSTSLEETVYNWNISDSNDALFISEIVCYGLGSFFYSMVDCFQLAFLLELRDFLKVKKVHIFDPVFSNEEISCLEDLGVTLITEDEKAKRKVPSKTIFFMPHCDLSLYNNLLYANWNINGISNLLIIGNSFSDYFSSNLLEYYGQYIQRAIPFVTEKKMPNFEIREVFNDTSIHYFEDKFISKIPASLWLKNEHPVYMYECFMI